MLARTARTGHIHLRRGNGQFPLQKAHCFAQKAAVSKTDRLFLDRYRGRMPGPDGDAGLPSSPFGAFPRDGIGLSDSQIGQRSCTDGEIFDADVPSGCRNPWMQARSMRPCATREARSNR